MARTPTFMTRVGALVGFVIGKTRGKQLSIEPESAPTSDSKVTIAPNVNAKAVLTEGNYTINGTGGSVHGATTTGADKGANGSARSGYTPEKTGRRRLG